MSRMLVVATQNGQAWGPDSGPDSGPDRRRPCHALAPMAGGNGHTGNGHSAPTPDNHGRNDGPALRAYSPGRVNLIGDHTDYNEGLALPMAIDLGTTITYVGDGGFTVFLRSSGEPHPTDVDVHIPLRAEVLRKIEPRWARYVAAMVASIRPRRGGRGAVETTLPVGSGLS
jgi:galactokinase